jgi:two-component system KDP operon response regulator KdpE
MNFGTILVVDDEPWSHHAVRTTLTNLGNYLVVPAKTSEEALALIRRESPDLVVIDLDMLGRVIRERDCLAACRPIRQASDRPIIVISERDTERDRVAALDAGADDFLAKPYGINELLARIRAVLRRMPLRNRRRRSS